MNPQDLARAPVNRLRKYCCKKCGGVLAQVWSKKEHSFIVVCGTNHCEPLEIEVFSRRSIRQQQEALDAMDVMENYPQFAPPKDENAIKKSMQALFPEEK